MKTVEFHTEARAELLIAADYYEARAQNLGHEFLNLIEQTYLRIQKYPEHGLVFGPHLRRAIVPRFPYALV